MNVCLCHSETIRQFCPVNKKSSDFVLSASGLTCAGVVYKDFSNVMFTCLAPMCVRPAGSVQVINTGL